MSTYPHVRDNRSTPAISFCACGASAVSATTGPASWGDDCPHLMREILTNTAADLSALRIEHAAWGVIIDATRAARDEARAEVAAYKVRVDGIEAERVIAVDAFHRIRRNRDDVAALANEARAEADALRVRVAELERLQASILKAADAARKAERADALAYATHIGDVYRGKHGGGGDYCRALGEFASGVQSGSHEGAAGVKRG